MTELAWDLWNDRCVVYMQLLTEARPPNHCGQQPVAPVADRRLEILKLSSSGVRAVTKQEDTCMICDEGDGTLLHCSGSCLQVFHSKCIGLSVAPASHTFTCDECLTGVVFYCNRDITFLKILLWSCGSSNKKSIYLQSFSVIPKGSAFEDLTQFGVIAKS